MNQCVILSFEIVVQSQLDLQDEWEYRRLLEIAWELDRGLVERLTLQGLESQNADVRETAEESMSELKETAMPSDFPQPGMELTHILVVSDLERARTFYKDVLGASLYGEYGGTSIVFNFNGAWLLVVTGGGPTDDKPDVTFTPPDDPGRLSHSITIRVPDCQQAYEMLRARGAAFLTPPLRWEHEIRAFFRDPDGHLFEISQVANLPPFQRDLKH